MSVAIRPIEERDLPAVVSLMRDFAEFEKLSQFLEVTEESLGAAMFGERAFVEGLICLDGGRPAGYALFYPNFASFRGQRGLYLEDLYLEPGLRGRGAGEAMLREIARIAAAKGCGRIDFQVLAWNLPAIGFYEKFGAVRDDDERHFRITDGAFRDLLS